MNEASAIQLCVKHKDPRGFEYLVETYRREAYFHAISLLGNRDDAVDACQESFGKAFAAMPGLSALDRFYPWFYRILRNCCLNKLSRRKTAARFISTETDGAKQPDVLDPAILLEKDEERQRIWQALHRIQPEFREILILKYIQGCCYDAISEKLKIPRGTVMSRLYHARKAFRDAYSRLRD